MPSFLLPSNQVNQCENHSIHIKGMEREMGLPARSEAPTFWIYSVKGQSNRNVDNRSSRSGEFEILFNENLAYFKGIIETPELM